MTVRKTKLRNRALAGASAAALGWAVASAALALPVNPTIFANSPIPGPAATFNPSAGTLTITQNAERVVIDWDSFNIANGETVTFVQPDAQAIAFNRIDPAAFTTIDGNLNANGSVWLFSPGGILFGSNAQVNTGSFFAGLGELDDFQANESVGLSDVSVFINYGAASNPNVLTVANGAQIFSNGFGFVVLQGSHIDMDGQVGGNGQQVGYIIAEGGVVDFQQGTLNPNGWELLHAHQSSDPSGRGQPYFNHGGQTLSDWIVIESAQFTDANFETVINLDGVMDGAVGDPSYGDGIHVWGGNSSTAPGFNGEFTTVNVLGQLSSGADISLDAASIVISGDIIAGQNFEAFAYDQLIVDPTGTIDAGADLTLHAHGDFAQIDAAGQIHADQFVDIWSTSAGTLTTVDGVVTAGQQVRVRSGGDVVIGQNASITGDVDANSLATDVGVIIGSGAALHTPGNTYYLSAGDILIEDGASIIGGLGAPDQVLITGNFGDVTSYGAIDGSRVVIRGNGTVTVGGEINTTDDLDLFDWTIPNPNGGGGVVVTGDAVLSSDNRLIIVTHGGDVQIETGATLISDADATPTVDLFTPAPTSDDLIINSAGSLVVESGVTFDAGENMAYLRSADVDAVGFTQAAIDISSDVDAGRIVMLAPNGSIRIRDGATMNTVNFFADAQRYFVLEQGASIVAQADPQGPQDPVEFPYTSFNEGVYVTIIAQDMALYGDVSAPGAIILTADTSAGYVYLGGVDGGADVDGYDLGSVTIITDAEFQNLHAPTVVLISGADGNQTALAFDSDITVRDLTVNGDEVQHLVLGTSTDNVVFITGEVSATGTEAPDLTIGFAAAPQGSPPLSLRSFIPGNVVITGSIGSLDNPFGQVTLIATGDIGMGTEDFLYAAVEDPEFDSAEQSGDFDVDPGHIWISAEGLSIATPTRVIQQNTGSPAEPAGLSIGSPGDGSELIFVPDGLDGLSIGGAQPFTLSFSEGPTRVELFGVVLGQNGEIQGRDVAQMDFLVDADIADPSSELLFNDCQMGGGACGGASEAPQFVSPTDMGEVEAVAESADDAKDDADEADDAEAEDQDSKLFRALVAPGADRAYEQERIGEPITGSGNEDLWTGHGAGDKP